MKKLKWLLLPLLIGCMEPTNVKDKAKVVHSMANTIQMQFKDVPIIDVEEAKKLLKNDSQNTVLVDVRSKDERQVSVIEGSLSLEEFEKKKSELKGKTIIPYCTIGYRSSEFVQKIQKEGFKAYNLKGSILSWVHAGGIVVDKNGPTKRVHVFGEAWNFVPAGYQGVYGD